MKKKRRICKPGSVWTFGPGSSSVSRSTVAGRLRCGPPAGIGRVIHPLLDLAPDKVFRSPPVAEQEVGSYPAFSPLQP